VPTFFFPQGKPINRDEKLKAEQAIEKEYEGKADQKITIEQFEGVCVNVCKLPKIFKQQLFDAVKLEEKLDEKADKIPKQTFVNYFKRHMEGESVAKRVFKILSTCKDKSAIVPNDFKPLFKHLLESHPGLEFLQATPEFQDRYADTVVMRIFFTLDSNDDGRITWRDFK